MDHDHLANPADQFAQHAPRGVAVLPDARAPGREAIVDTVNWIAGASLADIGDAGGLHKGDARELKEFCRQMARVQHIAAKRHPA